MRVQNSDDSDNQGFVANKIKIDHHVTKHEEKQHKNLKEFQPYYIPRQGIMRKEPPQAIVSVKTIPNMPREFCHKKIIPNISDPISAKELYSNIKLYSLVYKRFRDAFGSEETSTFQNLVKINCCHQNNEENYRTLKQWDSNYLQQQPYSENCLIFDSRFQGGNLLNAFKCKKEQNTYILFMQNDTNTYGYNQWFHFSVRNMKMQTKYTFRISNFKKKYSFFQNGLQPLLFSLKKSKATGNGWYRDGVDISYFPSEFEQKNSRPYFTLEFSVYFQNEEDYITFSPYAPYSYSKLISSLYRLQTIAKQNDLTWKLKSISRTLSYNQVPYVILSNKKVKKPQKKKILIMARQHSGQNWSSFLAESIMTNLVEQKIDQYKWLLENYDFHIIPMINVDGVIYGNFRCDLAGYDLNRMWKNPLEQLHPQIYHIKKEIAKLAEKYQIQMCLDLHNHSKEFGAFAYCCVDSYQCRQLPRLVSLCSPFFSYNACTFGIEGEKRNTARAAVFGMTNSLNVLTIQLSACGFNLKSKKYPIPYTPNHINSISKALMKGFYSYIIKSEPKIVSDPIQIQTEEGIQTLELSQISSYSQEAIQVHPVEGSDSEPEIDEISDQVKMKIIFQGKLISELTGNAKERKASKAKISKAKKWNKSINKTKAQTKIEIKRQESSIEKNYEKMDRSTNLMEPKTLEIEREVSSIIKLKKPAIHIQDRSKIRKHSLHPSERSQKVQVEKPAKQLNLIQFSLKKLPITAPQKISQQNYHILLEQNHPLFSTYGYGRREQNRFDKTFSTYQAMVRPRARVHSKKIGVAKEDNRLEHQLPFLCIMSETKKQLQLQKIKEKSEIHLHEKKQVKKNKHQTLTPQSRLQETPLMKIHNRGKQEQVFSKIISDQMTRYAESTFNRKN